MSGVIKFRKGGITLKELDEALSMGGMMRVDMGKLNEMMTPEQREKLFPGLFRYVLGFTVNGKRMIVYQSDTYPNGMHDLMSNICNEFVKQFPDDRISWFNECDGAPYSY